MADNQLDRAKQAVGPIGLVTPVGATAATRAPAPDEEWELPNGSARVYYGEGSDGISAPVLLADGFNLGPTDHDWLWAGLENGQFPFISRLRARGRTVVLLGFDERSASILDNAQTMIAAIQRTNAEQRGDTPLLVGGFSMGGMVARYALAKLEHDGIDHRTQVYLSYDTPHRGAWVPIGLQAFAQYVAPIDDTYARQINSDASQQMLWRHLDAVDGTPQESVKRTEFLRALHDVGGWPRRPRTLGIANGAGNGQGNQVPAGKDALSCAGPFFDQTRLITQARGSKVTVGELAGVLGGPHTVTTSGFPELDGAPGGTLESFGILGDTLESFGEKVDLPYRSVCFVPSVSAVAVRDLDRQEDLYVDIDSLSPEESELDEFVLSATNDPHTLMTEELGNWILERLPS
ncbi:esterase/lipase family protein [Streptomyces sp. NPDC058220]|uniref:esterase/lipase family protein n=1 Tax=unclassified Streptomyces TaxID=2593676 RepID=UPI0036551747